MDTLDAKNQLSELRTRLQKETILLETILESLNFEPDRENIVLAYGSLKGAVSHLKKVEPRDVPKPEYYKYDTPYKINS